MIELTNKKVLVVGSGVDLGGRRLGKEIDSNKWDVVIRCNKLYGDPADVGTRCDLLFSRWLSWQGTITPVLDCPTVFINDAQGITSEEVRIICEEVGHKWVSCGAVAVGYCLHRGAREISVVGFGYEPYLDAFCPKTYSPREVKRSHVTAYNRDTNPAYDWKKEANFYIVNNIRLV